MQDELSGSRAQINLYDAGLDVSHTQIPDPTAAARRDMTDVNFKILASQIDVLNHRLQLLILQQNEHHLRITTLESGSVGLHNILEDVVKMQTDQTKQAMGLTKRIEQQRRETDECLQQIQNDMEIFKRAILKHSQGIQTILDTIHKLPERLRLVVDQEPTMQQQILSPNPTTQPNTAHVFKPPAINENRNAGTNPLAVPETNGSF
ncbi:hypothetical protein TWF102_006991 [Orbilia oligospora]|uniref:Uncharacterized protein n=1 Tax=Orbilia oligospora TaxID=2813651 RepID=A0A7C8NAF3_ORBOL|nr:hypothetical protein TWF103_005865 [Orbilia oligospora]KAF3111318.1 hypothetical protein TWF102_006991 [Orbilia oligospora]